MAATLPADVAGVVEKADCDASVKETARAVLRMHSGVWSGSPCVSAYLLSRYL
uniref:Uncharacterized protein n=1 Tax=Oryza brachyantha TaxID=4533 RepID=J3NBL0_ORYBR